MIHTNYGLKCLNFTSRNFLIILTLKAMALSCGHCNNRDEYLFQGPLQHREFDVFELLYPRLFKNLKSEQILAEMSQQSLCSPYLLLHTQEKGLKFSCAICNTPGLCFVQMWPIVVNTNCSQVTNQDVIMRQLQSCSMTYCMSESRQHFKIIIN